MSWCRRRMRRGMCGRSCSFSLRFRRRTHKREKNAQRGRSALCGRGFIFFCHNDSEKYKITTILEQESIPAMSNKIMWTTPPRPRRQFPLTINEIRFFLLSLDHMWPPIFHVGCWFSKFGSLQKTKNTKNPTIEKRYLCEILCRRLKNKQ